MPSKNSGCDSHNPPLVLIIPLITLHAGSTQNKYLSGFSYLLLAQHLQLSGFGVMGQSGGYYDILIGDVVHREGAQGLQLKKKKETGKERERFISKITPFSFMVGHWRTKDTRAGSHRASYLQFIITGH